MGDLGLIQGRFGVEVLKFLEMGSPTFGSLKRDRIILGPHEEALMFGNSAGQTLRPWRAPQKNVGPNVASKGHQYALM